MAVNQRVITTCDWPVHEGLHGDDDKITTVEFGIDGPTYEIDLCDQQATELRELLANYATHGRRKAKATTAAAPASTGPVRGEAAKQAREKREYLGKVRDWANKQRTDDGAPRFSVSDRGQVAAEIRYAYDMAMAQQPQPEPPQQQQQPEQPDHYALPAELRLPAFSGAVS